MKEEYLIFNLFVFLGPFALSFDRKVHFYSSWPSWLKAVWAPSLVFILWDTLVANRHWFFSDAYTTGIHYMQLPIEEILFFITVPYACLFTWACIKAYFTDISYSPPKSYGYWPWLSAITGSLLFVMGLEYTGLVMLSLAVMFYLDKRLAVYLFFRRHFMLYFGIVAFFTLVFNGYLTARPVVTYDYAYQLEWLIGTIPIEDFFYGFALLFTQTILFERFTSASSRKA